MIRNLSYVLIVWKNISYFKEFVYKFTLSVETIMIELANVHPVTMDTFCWRVSAKLLQLLYPFHFVRTITH